MTVAGKHIDWARWIPHILSITIWAATVTWFAATTKKDVEATQVGLTEIARHTVPEIKQEFRSLRNEFSDSKSSQQAQNERLIRIEEQMRFTVQTLEEVKRLLQKDARIRDMAPNL